MVTFRNNNRRNNFRRNDRGFKPNGDRPKYGTNFSNNENFQRKIPSRNNHNASKLIEKYKNSVAIRSKSIIEDFLYIMHAEKIIMSVSTFSWMASWLSDAKKIYFPVDDYIFNRDGDNRLIVDDEPRYRYVNVKDYNVRGRKDMIINKINELRKVLFNKY